MNSEVTGRERVKKALNHEEADRFPIDLGMQYSTGISAFAYHNLRKYLGLSTDRIEIADNVQMLARVDQDILDLFHCDTILLWPPHKKTMVWNVRDDYRFLVPEQMAPTQEDGYWIVRRGEVEMRMPPGGFFFDGGWIRVWDYTPEEWLLACCREAERLEKESDKFTCLLCEFVAFFTNIDMACDMLTDPDTVHAYNRDLLKKQIDKVMFIAKHGGRDLDCIEFCSDLGMQSGPMLSPDCYEEFVFPYMKELITVIHENTGAKVFLHCCGSVFTLIPYLIEAGLDILSPVQISADHMDPMELKKAYGDRITFWGGGCNTQKILGFKDEETVRENTRMLSGIFKPGGGFVFNQVHNIMGNVPPQNIMAMFDEAYKNSFYPSKG
ncbi:MAG: uroporphyrinogen decarboxylase family protein [Treponema sp.]|jgi:uroporphyrinogen decarboxylase|nr:uroporphyrinogen decarboxylase family protein [Treponema sp.]